MKECLLKEKLELTLRTRTSNKNYIYRNILADHRPHCLKTKMCLTFIQSTAGCVQKLQINYSALLSIIPRLFDTDRIKSCI